MARKTKTEVENVEQTTENQIPEPNIVHGLDFGNKTKMKVVRNGSTIDFLFVSGNKQTLNVDSLSEELLKEAALYGLEAKVKASLASKGSIDEVEEEVSKQLAGYVNGTFYLRNVGEAVYGLSLELEAFAKVKALQEGFEHWANTGDSNVAREVLEFWKNVSRADKNRIMKNSSVMGMLVQLKLERGVEDVFEF